MTGTLDTGYAPFYTYDDYANGSARNIYGDRVLCCNRDRAKPLATTGYGDCSSDCLAAIYFAEEKWT